MNKEATLNLRLEPGIKAALNERAWRERRSMADLARDILAEWLEAHGDLKPEAVTK